MASFDGATYGARNYSFSTLKEVKMDRANK